MMQPHATMSATIPVASALLIAPIRPVLSVPQSVPEPTVLSAPLSAPLSVSPSALPLSALHPRHPAESLPAPALHHHAHQALVLAPTVAAVQAAVWVAADVQVAADVEDNIFF